MGSLMQRVIEWVGLTGFLVYLHMKPNLPAESAKENS